MVFEGRISDLNYKTYSSQVLIQKHISIDGSRATEIEKIKTVVKEELTGKKLADTKFFRMATEHLISTIEELPEDEALKLLYKLFKDTSI